VWTGFGDRKKSEVFDCGKRVFEEFEKRLSTGRRKSDYQSLYTTRPSVAVPRRLPTGAAVGFG